MTPFTPNGEKSYALIVYEKVKDWPTGVDIPWAAMPLEYDRLIGLRETVSKILEREQSRHLVSVYGVGWRVVAGLDQVIQAERRRRLATRRLGRALQVASTVNRREMSAEERVRLDEVTIALQTTYGVARGLAAQRLSMAQRMEQIKAWEQENGREAA